MVVSIKSLSSAMKSIANGVVSSSVGITAPLPKLALAARSSQFGQAPGETIAGITTITENLSQNGLTPQDFQQPYAVLTDQIPGLYDDLVDPIPSGLQSALNALEGTIDGAGTAKPNFLHEVVTMATAQAVNNVLGNLTGKSSQQLESILRQISPRSVSGQVLDGLKEFDEASLSTPKLTIALNSSDGILQSLVLSVGPAVIDNVAIDIDPVIQERLQIVLASNRIPKRIKQGILSNIYSGNLDAAAKIVQDYPTGLTEVSEIIAELQKIELDPNIVIGGSGHTAYSINAGDRTFGTDQHNFEYVATAEEFEAIIAGSTRTISTFILQFTGIEKDLSSNEFNQIHNEAGYDGNQYHFIIRRDGIIQRGRPINTPGSSTSGISGAEIVTIAFTGTIGINIPQSTTYRHITEAVYRIIPGAQFIESAQLSNISTRSPSASLQIGFNPATVNNSINGAGGDGGTFVPNQGMIPRVAAYGQPGLAQNLQPDLIAILEYAAANTIGVTGLQTTSGVRRTSIGSGRHYEGWASDTAILGADGRKLHVADTNYPDDLEIIQNFCRLFIAKSRSEGFQPSVGVANPAISNRRLYMGGNHFHFDIAAGRATVKRVSPAIWGQSDPHGAPPQWLVDMY